MQNYILDIKNLHGDTYPTLKYKYKNKYQVLHLYQVKVTIENWKNTVKSHDMTLLNTLIFVH